MGPEGERLPLVDDRQQLIQSAIANALRNPTAAVYAQYLDGQMEEGRIRGAIGKHIAARLARLGINVGKKATGPAVPGTPEELIGEAETGDIMLERLVDAEIANLRNTFSGFTPKRWQGGETIKDYEARIAAYSPTIDTKPGSLAPHPVPIETGYAGFTGEVAPPPVTVAPTVPATTTTAVPVVEGQTPVGMSDAEYQAQLAGISGTEYQAQLNAARALAEQNRLAREVTPWTAPPVASPVAPSLPFQADLDFMGGPQVGAATPGELSGLIRREREATQEGRNLELLDFLNRTFNFGGLSPIVQRPLSRAVGSGPDLTSQYFTQLFGQGSPTGQVPTQTFASFLQGGLPTAGSLQANLRNITGQLGQGGDSPFLSTLQGTFGDPKDVFGAALQPGLKRVAPAVRGAFESQAGQQFQNVLAADPMRFKTPRESFRYFGNQGYF
jgi:hypothetical protein